MYVVMYKQPTGVATNVIRHVQVPIERVARCCQSLWRGTGAGVSVDGESQICAGRRGARTPATATAAGRSSSSGRTTTTTYRSELSRSEALRKSILSLRRYVWSV